MPKINKNHAWRRPIFLGALLGISLFGMKTAYQRHLPARVPSPMPLGTVSLTIRPINAMMLTSSKDHLRLRLDSGRMETLRLEVRSLSAWLLSVDPVELTIGLRARGKLSPADLSRSYQSDLTFNLVGLY